MAADKDAEFIEVSHSDSIPIIRVHGSSGQVYREKNQRVSAQAVRSKVHGLPDFFQLYG